VYCPACGAANEDNAGFCAACGAQMNPQAAPPPPPGGQPAPPPPAAQPAYVQQPAQAPRSGGGLSAVKILAIIIPLIVIIIGGVIVWFLFFKPMDPNDYEAKVEDEFLALEEGVGIMGDAVSDILAAADGGIDGQDLNDLRADFEEGADMARSATGGIDGLREPDEYSRAHRDAVAYMEFARNDLIDPVSEVVDGIQAGDDTSDIGRDLQRVMERVSSDMPRMDERLWEIKEELYLPDDLEPLAGIKLSPVTVTVSWTDPVDIDLGATDNATGDSVGYLKNRDAMSDASERSETLEFIDHGDYDLTTGNYEITAYYASMGNTSLDAVNVTVTVTMPSGAEVSFNRMVDYDGSSDLWHVINLDAATGEYEELGWAD